VEGHAGADGRSAARYIPEPPEPPLAPEPLPDPLAPPLDPPPSPLVPLVPPRPLVLPLLPRPLVLPVPPVMPALPDVEDPPSDPVPPVEEFTLLLPVPAVPAERPEELLPFGAPMPLAGLPMPAPVPAVVPPRTPGLVPAEPATPAAPFSDPVVPAPAVVPVVPAVPAPEKPTQSGDVRHLPVAGSKQSARRCVLAGSVGSELVVPVVADVPGLVGRVLDDVPACDHAGDAPNAAAAASAAARVLILKLLFMEPPVKCSWETCRCERHRPHSPSDWSATAPVLGPG
jgi:hypothetical protein